MILPSLHQPWLNVCLRHSSTALAVEFIVGVDPFAVVYASFNPASSSRRRILPPATRPNPRGAGRISTTTLPPLPRTLNGTECFWEHLHSQLPHPSLIGLTLMYAWVVAFSMAMRICFDLPSYSKPAIFVSCCNNCKAVRLRQTFNLPD